MTGESLRTRNKANGPHVLRDEISINCFQQTVLLLSHAPRAIESAYLDTHRAMVAASYARPDKGTLQAGSEQRRDQKIINAPSDVSGACTRHLTPPCVMPSASFELAKRIEKASLHKRAEAGAFLGREAMVLYVGLGIGEINFRVCHVEVAAKDHGLFLFQFL